MLFFLLLTNALGDILQLFHGKLPGVAAFVPHFVFGKSPDVIGKGGFRIGGFLIDNSGEPCHLLRRKLLGEIGQGDTVIGLQFFLHYAEKLSVEVRYKGIFVHLRQDPTQMIRIPEKVGEDPLLRFGSTEVSGTLGVHPVAVELLLGLDVLPFLLFLLAVVPLDRLIQIGKDGIPENAGLLGQLPGVDLPLYRVFKGG